MDCCNTSYRLRQPVFERLEQIVGSHGSSSAASIQVRQPALRLKSLPGYGDEAVWAGAPRAIIHWPSCHCIRSQFDEDTVAFNAAAADFERVNADINQTIKRGTAH